MRTATKNLRSLRIWALSACIVAVLALPAAASAMPHDPIITLRQENGFPLATVHHAPPGQAAVHVIRTVSSGGGDTTLPTVLAAAALGIALAGLGYVTVRLRPQPRGS